MCKVDLEEGQGGGFFVNIARGTLRMRTVSGFAYCSVCKCCTTGFLLSVSGRRVEASLPYYTVSLVGICLNV